VLAVLFIPRVIKQIADDPQPPLAASKNRVQFQIARRNAHCDVVLAGMPK